MRKIFDIRSLLCGAMLGASIVLTVAAATGKRTSWEYITHYYNASHPDTAALNKLGNEGWELVGYFGGREDKSPGFIFKRAR